MLADADPQAIPRTCHELSEPCARIFTSSAASRPRDLAPFILTILPSPSAGCTYMYTQWPAIQRPARRMLPPGPMGSAARTECSPSFPSGIETARVFRAPTRAAQENNHGASLEHARDR